MLLSAGHSTIRHLRAALAAEFKDGGFPVLRDPPGTCRREPLIFLSETGETSLLSSLLSSLELSDTPIYEPYMRALLRISVKQLFLN